MPTEAIHLSVGQEAVAEIHKRPEANAVESVRLDGNDARAAFAEVGRLIAAMRSDGKPQLVELMTYRWHGHMEGDPESYRTAVEKDRFKKEDPIARLQNELIQKGIIDTPLSENAFGGGAVGAAMTGMRSVSEVLFADFLTCCMDPILNQAAKLRYMTGGQVRFR